MCRSSSAVNSNYSNSDGIAGVGGVVGKVGTGGVVGAVGVKGILGVVGVGGCIGRSRRMLQGTHRRTRARTLHTRTRTDARETARARAYTRVDAQGYARARVPEVSTVPGKESKEAGVPSSSGKVRCSLVAPMLGVSHVDIHVARGHCTAHYL